MKSGIECEARLCGSDEEAGDMKRKEQRNHDQYI